ncbi:MAG: cytochrome c [FCB group bacterium]|nr:cytochrome c [FCB group bacterium]
MFSAESALPIRYLVGPMTVHLPILAALAAVVITGCARTDEVAPTGQSLYLRHCASCHGIAGGGDGPIASHPERRRAGRQTIAPDRHQNLHETPPAGRRPTRAARDLV